MGMVARLVGLALLDFSKNVRRPSITVGKHARVCIRKRALLYLLVMDEKALSSNNETIFMRRV